MEKPIENVNPQVFAKANERVVLPDEEDDSVRDEIDAREIFGMVTIACTPHSITPRTLCTHHLPYSIHVYTTQTHEADILRKLTHSHINTQKHKHSK